MTRGLLWGGVMLTAFVLVSRCNAKRNSREDGLAEHPLGDWPHWAALNEEIHAQQSTGRKG